ncbi:Oxo-4-hydroxy-4-carboxy-5-ureidoimidazoline decarboxylase [Lineolata rhizophorae]|uniref:Oxo-4-hydroxy-4-carboxy-5-ureidoimidazoline decarboxylase n=1 Tax=Lineolata rhizophorae TaxID=578093 RepID=A0A6A6NPK0_9PEZI|nr:Oxo-4-hydroxy-4-carboxy-5-ureidoimidazoline decarboxylase [Lineolata rhizophorae]
MTPAPLPSLSALPTAPRSSQTALLDALFEPSPAMHALALPLLAHPPPPSSLAALVLSVQGALMTLAANADYDPARRDMLEDVLGAHPRLGAANAGLSEESRREQAAMEAAAAVGPPPGEDERRREADELARLNAEYERAFPGMRYVVFVNGRPRADIMRDMRKRIERADIEEERLEAIRAMCAIALDRGRKLGIE